MYGFGEFFLKLPEFGFDLRDDALGVAAGDLFAHDGGGGVAVEISVNVKKLRA